MIIRHARRGLAVHELHEADGIAVLQEDGVVGPDGNLRLEFLDHPVDLDLVMQARADLQEPFVMDHIAADDLARPVEDQAGVLGVAAGQLGGQGRVGVQRPAAGRHDLGGGELDIDAVGEETGEGVAGGDRAGIGVVLATGGQQDGHEEEQEKASGEHGIPPAMDGDR